MKLTKMEAMRAGGWLGLGLLCMVISLAAAAQGVSTTTVQGTVYSANGQPGSGTLQVSWPTFTTANNLAIAAGRATVTIGLDGFVTLNLAPNQGATPAGLYYTAVYHLSDGTTSTEYWVVPSAPQATIAEVRAQVMPAAQAVQTVSKTYVDQSVQELTQSLLTASGGNLSGPLYLNGDPSQPTQAATKHYVDNSLGQAVSQKGGTMSGPLYLNGDPSQPTQAATKEYVDGAFSQTLPMSGGASTGELTGLQLGAAFQVDQFHGADFGAKLQACLNGLSASYGGTCDARNFSGNLVMSASLTVSTANVTVQLPCATIATAYPIVVTAGTRNVTFHGCALRGASTASGSQGGSVLLYSGASAGVQVGDATYAIDTLGFHMDNVVINTTASQSQSAQGITAFRTQEVSLANLYLLGNANQTGMTLDGTGNYTGGTFQDLEFSGFQIAVNGIGHQIPNGASTDWLNASAFLRLHIDCPLSGGSPLSGTYGINLAQGDGNTFTGGDVEGCATALHLGPNAQNNTIVGLRNENSMNQVVADAGSAYNNWITGGTMFTGQLVDNGTRNSFLDTFHRSFNGLNGDWYGSQQDATVTNHYRVGIGSGNERGLLNRYQSDYGYRWTTGLSDAAAGEQFYQVLDELNNVYRLSIGQYNHGQASSNNQTVINAAGTGAVVLNGSSNAGTGGVIFGAGGGSGATVATINNAGNAQFNGSLQVGGPSTFTSSTTVKNGTDAEIDAFLWAGATANQKESFIYKDYTGTSQWYLVKDASNNWALNSATGGLDSFKAYQSTNSGDTYINASNGTGHIRLNYESGAGAETDIYSGGSSGLVAAFLGATSIKLPGLAAGSGKNCVQIDNSGYISNTGTSCGSGTIGSGTAGQVAVYSANGTTVAGASAVSVTAGGTGATNAATALSNLGAQAAMPGVTPDGASGLSVSGSVAASAISTTALNGYQPAGRFAVAMNRDAKLNGDLGPENFNASGNGSGESGDDCTAIVNAINLTTAGMPGIPDVVHLHGKNYRCTKANAYAVLPMDFGDYLNTSSGAGAAVGLTVVNGKIKACQVSGGSGYNPNAYLPVQIQDFSYQGSGAAVHVLTNSLGQPSNCVVDQAGINYPTYGVVTTVYPIGADGASATIQLTNGTFATTGTVATGGNGYTAFPVSGVPVGSAAVQCTVYPNISGTVAGGLVTGISSTAGIGCTYNGASTATVPVCVGGCVNGVQATNVAPEPTNVIGIAIPVRQGITIDCDGGSIQTDYWQGTADLNQLVVFGDPWGNQAQNVTIRNCQIGGFGDAWFAGSTRDVVFDHDVFGAQALAQGFGNLGSASGSSFGIYAAQMGSGTVVSNSLFLGNAGVICGGQWDSRTGGNGGQGSLGGNDVSSKSSNTAGGSCDGLELINDDSSYGVSTASGYVNNFSPPVISGVNNYNANLDSFFRDYVWKINNSPLADGYASWGTGTCYGTQTAYANRAIDWNFGNVSAKASSDPWMECYRGVSDMYLVGISRSGHASHVAVNGLQNSGSYRPLVLGTFTLSNFVNVGANGGGTFTDPYAPNGAKEPGVIEVHGTTTPQNTYWGISSAGTSTQVGNRSLTIYSTTLNATDFTGSSWAGITSTNGQASYNTLPPLLTNVNNATVTSSTIGSSTLSNSNAYQGGTWSGTWTGIPSWKDANGNSIWAPYNAGSFATLLSGAQIDLDGKLTYLGNPTATNTFIAPGTSNTPWMIVDEYYNSGTSQVWSNSWSEHDTSNTAATVTPTAVNRAFSCSYNGGASSCLPYKDTITYPSGSTLTYAGLTSFTPGTIVLPGTLYSGGGTVLPACNSTNKGALAVVSDAVAPTYMGTYTSGGAITAPVVCSYNGSAYTWLTH